MNRLLLTLAFCACGSSPPAEPGATGGGSGESSCAPFPAWTSSRTSSSRFLSLVVAHDLFDHDSLYDTLSLTARTDQAPGIPGTVDLSTSHAITTCSYCISHCESCYFDGGNPQCQRCFMGTSGTATTQLQGQLDGGTLTTSLDGVTFSEDPSFGTAAPTGACYRAQHLEFTVQLR